jgi:hypothetical protein
MERLEDRLAPADLFVTNLSDSGPAPSATGPAQRWLATSSNSLTT